MHNFITIKDIAKALNISVSTVSRALRDAYNVNQETRSKVLEMAAKMNYKPNFNARGLAKGGSHNIGIIIPFITDYYFSTVIRGIQEVAYTKGYNIILFVTNDSPEREFSIVNNLSVSNLDGLLVSIASDSDNCSHFQNVINDGVPIVFFDRTPNKIKTSKVMQDDYKESFEAVEYLIKCGYKKISHITGRIGLVSAERRLNGYIDALKKHCLPVKEEWIIQSNLNLQDGIDDVSKLLKCDVIPDAIFAVNDRKAIGAIIALKNKKIIIGKEMGVMGFTNEPTSSIISPTLSTVAEPAFHIGQKSCELLFKHINKKNFIGEEIMIPGELIVRDSTSRK